MYVNVSCAYETYKMIQNELLISFSIFLNMHHQGATAEDLL